jgi:hypothetical protein
MMRDLLPALNDPNFPIAATAFSTLETRVNNNMYNKKAIREFLRKWQCEPRPYVETYNTVTKKFLKSLTIFKNLGVPLFTDNYGRKTLMSDYIDLVENVKTFKDFAKKYNLSGQATLEGEQVDVKWKVNLNFFDLMIGIRRCGSVPWYVYAENIYIEVIPISLLLDTPIVHVTHTAEKVSIVKDQKLKPSDNKNSVEGIWFSPKYNLSDPQDVIETSVYGLWAFETTLRRLGVSGIRQGEIVSYKNEVNFILYASDTVPPDPVMKKASGDAVKFFKNNADAYAAMSIFVPSRFLLQGEAFGQAFKQPYELSHKGFCVKARRSETTCKELNNCCRRQHS